MGYAIIKTSTLNAYALNRKILNVIPKDDKYRKLIPSNANFTYGTVSTEGICRLSSVDLKDGTLPYEYKLCSSAGVDLSNQLSRAGVRIDPISGVIVLSSDYDGQDVWVRLAPKTVTGYYDTSVLTLYKKVIPAGSWTPVIPDTHTAVLDSIVYNFGNSLNWNSNSITAAATLLTLSSVTITYDGESNTFSGEALNDFYNDVTNISIVGKVNNTKIVDWTETLRQFTISANPNSSPRTILFTITFKYKGEDVSWVHPNGLALSGNVLNSVSNVTGPNELTVGTTLVAGNYSATGTYSNGTTGTVYATGISPSTVSQGTNNYTLTFADNVAASYSITGLAVVTKASIEYISGSPYDTKDANSYRYPLQVYVKHINGQEEFMSYNDYLALNEVKEEYNAPIVTISDNPSITQNNMPIINSSDGSLLYDFSLDNYIYDHTVVEEILIQHSTDSSLTRRSQSTYNVRRSSNEVSYFEDNFTEVPLIDINHQVVSYNGGTNPYVTMVASGSSGRHLSNDSLPAQGTYKLSGTGEVFKLNTDVIPQGYVLKGTNGYRSVIVTTDSTVSNLSTSGLLPFDGINAKYIDFGDSRAPMYVKHAPTISGNTYIIDFAYSGFWEGYRSAWTLLIPTQNPYGDIDVTREISVSSNSVSASGEQVTIIPPEYSLSYNGGTVTNEGTITYSISIDNGDFSEVTVSNNVVSLPANTTSSTRVITLRASIQSHNKHAVSEVTINQAANSTVTAPKITSIVANVSNSHNYPYGLDTAQGSLVTNNNKLQIEFPLEVNVSGVGKMTYEQYKLNYPNSTYGNVTATFKDPSSSGALYANASLIDPVTGNYVIDLKADKCIVDRTALSKITINNSSSSNSVSLSSDIPTIHKHCSPTVSGYFNDNFNWSNLTFTTSNALKFTLSSAHKLGESYPDGDKFKFSSTSGTGRLRLLDLASCYYLRLSYSEFGYFNFAILEVPNGNTLNNPTTGEYYYGADYNAMLGGYYNGGDSGEGASGYMYVKYTPSDPNNKVYYIDAISSDKVSNTTVLLGIAK